VRPQTLALALAHLQALGLDRLDAQMLLLHVLGQPTHQRAWLLAHDTDPMDAPHWARAQTLASRRLQGEPLAYLTGSKAFFGLELQVDARVLVPRPDTEPLVEWALEVLPPAGHGSTSALDLGTGSGAIALALKASCPDLQICALDFSEDALAVARGNAQRLGLEIEFQQGSWLAGVSSRFTLIVSNPPYIAADDAHLAALVHEPIQALTSGADGLDDLRRIIRDAPARLLPGGWLLLEHGYDQAGAVRELLAHEGFEAVQSRCDLNGIERCSGARLPG
jgi:release factor glutamine methyltransferase